MNLYPAIDLQSGKCVRLYQGCYEKVTTYDPQPITVAKDFARQGADFLHIVDLDGAQNGRINNAELIIEIANECGLNVQTGGGIRSWQHVRDYLAQGIHRVILGSVAVTQPQQVMEWIAEFGCERIVIALDVRIDETRVPKLALHGWQTCSTKSLWELLDLYQDSLLKHVLCTDIDRDGTFFGPNCNLYQECIQHYPLLQLQASGGIASLADIKKLSALNVSGAVVGKALYEQKFSLKDAFKEVALC